MELLTQATALMITGMAIVFGMLAALIGVIQLNARIVHALGLDAKPGGVPPQGGAAGDAPVVAIIAAAISAHERDSQDSVD